MSAGEKRRIRKSYDELGGKLYDERYELEQTSKYDAIIRHSAISTDDIVLDNGCATGLLLERFHSWGIGIDISSSLLSTALLRLRKFAHIFLIQADADHLPLRSHIFEKVFAVTVIQNTPKPKLAFREMGRVVRVDSEVIVTALKKSFTSQEFRQLIAASGFTLKYFIEDEGLKDWIAFVTI